MNATTIAPSASRDQLSVWIPRRISEMEPAEILAEIERLRTERTRLLAAVAVQKAKAARPRGPRKTRAVDLTKLTREQALAFMLSKMKPTL